MARHLKLIGLSHQVSVQHSSASDSCFQSLESDVNALSLLFTGLMEHKSAF